MPTRRQPRLFNAQNKFVATKCATLVFVFIQIVKQFKQICTRNNNVINFPRIFLDLMIYLVSNCRTQGKRQELKQIANQGTGLVQEGAKFQML